MDFWKTRDRSLIVTKGNLITDGEIRYLKKIMAAHIGKLEDTTLFDDDLQKKNVEFSKSVLSKLDSLSSMGNKKFSFAGLESDSDSVDEIIFRFEGSEVGKLSLC